MRLNNTFKRISAVLIITVLFISCMHMGAEPVFAKTASSKISISPKKATMKVGDTKKLKIKYKSPKLKKKTVKWKSSNKKIATVNKKGVIKAKKSGNVTITAKVGKHKAKIKVKVKSKKKDSAFVDATDAYKHLNDFRTKEGVWQWDKNNTTKTYFNTASTVKLEPLKRDTALENTAEKRAKELVKSFSHTRPNGESCFTAYPQELTYMGENIAYGYETAYDVTYAFAEEDEKYEGQGHRRNMLSKDFTHVGIAGYKYQGIIYWVQCFGRR